MTTTSQAIQFLLLGGLLGGLGLGLVTLKLNASGPGQRLAMLFCGLLAVIGFSEVADLLGWYGQVALVDLLVIPLVRAAGFLCAPTLYLYAVTCLGTRPVIPRPAHAVPAVICWGVFTWAEAAGTEGEWLTFAFWIAFAVHAVLYMLAILRLLIRRARTLKGFFSTLPAGSVQRLRRLWLILLVPVATILAELVSTRMVPIPEAVQIIGGALRMAAVLAAIALLVTDQLQPAEPHKPSADRPYAKSKIEPAEAERLAARLRAVMERRALHRDPLLDLSGLARQARIPEHQISQVLNRHLGLSFYDFVNHYRIAEAKLLLRAETSTVLDVALAVGYNSKSTFYAAFRKTTGQTPSEYRQISDA
mgnify:CR=1 FL=1